MDLQIFLIGIPAFVVIAILIYLINAFAMREKTFEEVIAEQKQRQEEERERAKQGKKIEKELYKKKYRKGKSDKSKEKSAQVSAPELKEPVIVEPEVTEPEHKMVNLEIEPEIIEPSDAVVLGAKPKTKISRKSKPILVNKNEVTPIAEKATELPHKPITPRDEIELKKLHDKEVVAAVHAPVVQMEAPAKKETRIVHQTESKQHVTETVKEAKVQKTKAPRVESVEIQQNAAQEETEKKISKTKNLSDPAASGQRLVEVVRSATLSDKEIQTLTEILINRQGATQDAWNKKNQKGDPAAALKKQLEEKEKALQEAQQQTLTANNRLKELKNELTADRTKFANTEKRYQEKVTQQKAELEAMQQRMRHAHEQHIAETGDLRGRLQHFEKAGDAIQKLKQENKILQESLAKVTKEIQLADVNSLRQKVDIMQKELSSNALKLHTADNSKRTLEQKLHKLEEQTANSESTRKVLEGKFEEVSAELHKAEAKNIGLASDLKKATGALGQAETECASLKSKLQELEKYLSSGDATKEIGAKLQEAERKKLDLEGNLKNVEKQLADSVQHRNELSMELMQLRQENQTLKEELRVSKEQRQQAEGQESPPLAANGDIHKEGSDKDIIQLEEHERILSEKMAELTSLQQELETERSAASLLKASVDNQAVQVKELHEQLDAQKQKNNEATAKALADLELVDKGMLHRLFPDISVSEKLGHKEWVAAFEKQAAQHMAKVSSAGHSEKEQIQELESENTKLKQQVETYEKAFAQANSDQEKLCHLEEENKRLKEVSLQTSSLTSEVSSLKEANRQLQSQVEEYKNIVSESEKKLQDLEHSVESEEKKWKEKLQQAEEASERNSRMSSREQELEELTIQQQAQMEDYRSVLSSTESTLRQLESRVEAEEKKWQEKVQGVQKELEKSKAECQRLEGEIQKLHGSTEMQSKIEGLELQLQNADDNLSSVRKEKEESQSRLVSAEDQLKQSEERIIVLSKEKTEMQSKIEDLEKQLQNSYNSPSDGVKEKEEMRVAETELRLKESEERITVLLREKEEVQSRLVNAEDQLKQSEERIDTLLRKKNEAEAKVTETNLRLKESEERIIVISQEKEQIQVASVVSSDAEDWRKRLEELQHQLESERKKNKDLSSTLVRLNGIIRTGQDALAQEQKLVRQLQDQLEEKTKGSDVPASQEIEQWRETLRAKLNEKEKQLEREIAANKQLSQRLGQLGVLSTSAGNDGTSV